MPASREISYHDALEELTVSVEPVGEKRIYFTDEAPGFDLVVRNGLDKPVLSRKESGITWVMGVGHETREPHYWDSIEISLEPGETLRHRIGGELLAYEGNGIIGINAGMTLHGGLEKPEIIIEPQDPSSGGYRWLYTFTVWDKSHYDAVHERPKELLRTSTRLSWGVLIAAVITAIVGSIQLAIALGWLAPP